MGEAGRVIGGFELTMLVRSAAHMPIFKLIISTIIAEQRMCPVRYLPFEQG
eukprot:CAMPEP_0119368702 /NCGR_PEP_ID=MMETSP1334-20130426/15318_1 /TAXON_ID=127549 /ORGANISM="Calcidiscus leptoporus, Strain RCC1130" /LENGTH=50 /DNA_ID=CAMNT_0007385397 /DNA_START=909 /DNA_END=1061 /DNA_ORIENTATION=-